MNLPRPTSHVSPNNAAGLLSMLYNSTQSSPPAGAAATNSLSRSFFRSATLAFLLVAPGVGWLSTQPLTLRPMEWSATCIPKVITSIRSPAGLNSAMVSPSLSMANPACSPGASWSSSNQMVR